MKKTLVIAAHPHIDTSTVKKRWIEELSKHSNQITVHELYKVYPDKQIDIHKEQELITQHDNLILQFPVYWFSCPPLLKQWLDDVFTYGWAYGSSGDKLKNKKVGLAVSLGSSEENYVHPFTLDATLRPFEMTMKYVNADYQGAFALYGANNEPESPYQVTSAQVNQSAVDYIKFLSQL